MIQRAFPSFSALLLLLPLAACSSSNALVAGAGGGGGEGAQSGAGAGGGGGACSIGAQDELTWTFESPGVGPLPLTDLATHTGDPPVSVELDGIVGASAPGTLTIDSCDPAADCGASLTTLTFAANGLDPAPVPAGALVHLSFWSAVGTNTHSSFYTSLHVRVENLPQWANITNPVSDGTQVWLALHDHAVSGGPNILTSETDPFLFEKEVACTDELSNLIYTLTASFNGSSAGAVTLHAGEQVELDVSDGAAPGHYVLHNLRSFDYIEPTNEIAYWLTGEPAL